MARTAILSTSYLGPVQYFTKFVIYDKICIETEENYQKQSYRNRCEIMSSNGKLPLSVPVTRNGVKIKTKDVRIDNSLSWQKDHWIAIESAYSASPFFEFFMDDFYPFYQQRFEFLLDYNNQLMELILGHLELSPQIEYKDHYEHHPVDMDDFRTGIHPKKRVQRPDHQFKSYLYYQVFEDRLGFMPNLSIIDLLFNEGANAENILRKSID